MAGLLDLPSELLLNIIDLVLSSPIVQPKNGTRYRSTNTFHRNMYCIPSLDHFQGPRPMNLLLVNRRMYIETREYLSKAPRNFELDIAVVNDHWLWPTRRIVPTRKLNGTIERLDINIIPCCTEGQRSLQTEWDDRENLVTEALLAPLIRFLLYPQMGVQNVKHISHVFQGLGIWVGPPSNAHSTDQSDYDGDLPVSKIDTVAILVSTLRYGNGNQTLSPAVVPSRKVEGLAHLDFEQLYPVDHTKSEHYLRGLSNYIDEWTHARGTERVGKRVSKIQFYLNGEIWKELDFTRCATDA